MPRRSVAEARQTREAIIARAVEVASEAGLEGVTLGRLAADLEMSKAGVIGHFGSKEGLQLAAIEVARRTFIKHVAPPAQGAEPGLPRLLVMLDAWVDHMVGGTYPGGCFWAAAASEFDGRPGPVRDAVLAQSSEWHDALRREIVTAIEKRELPEDSDVEQLLFELRAIGLGLNQARQLHRSEDADERARRAMRRTLGLA